MNNWSGPQSRTVNDTDVNGTLVNQLRKPSYIFIPYSIFQLKVECTYKKNVKIIKKKRSSMQRVCGHNQTKRKKELYEYMKHGKKRRIVTKILSQLQGI